MNENPLISVIVPIYNVDKYLDQCLESLINQTYSNLEILLIDDGSTDNSGNLCNKYAKTDKRIKVFHKENKGVSAARNYGISNSTGRFISFIDPDDFVDVDFYECLLAIQNVNDADISYCSFRKISENGELLAEHKFKKNNKVSTYNRKEATVNCLRARKGFQMFIWNGLFKKEIIPLFIEGRTIGEDQDFTIKAILNSTTVSRKEIAKYNYRIRQSGSKSLELEKRILFQKAALETIKSYLINADLDNAVWNAYDERCFRMDLGLMDRYASGQKRDTKLFLALRSNLIKDVQKTYKNPLGKILATLFNSKESLYRLSFKIIKFLQRRR